MRASFLAAFLLAAGCYEPAYEPCGVRCGAAGCPASLTCGSDGYCHAAGEPPSCAGDDASPIDAVAPPDALASCTFALAAGERSGTEYFAATQRLALAAGAGTGTWVSPVLDLGTTTAITTLSWSAIRPSLRPLPAAQAVETGFVAGNADMSGNRLLLHLSEHAGTSFADVSGGDHDATCAPVATCPTRAAPARFGRGLGFDGADDRLTVAAAPALAPTDAFTLEAWARADGAGSGTTGMIASKGQQGGGPFASFALEHDRTAAPANRLKCYATIGGDDLTVFGTSTFAPGASPFFHAACVYDGASLTIYVDGQPEGSAAVSGAVSYAIADGTFYVGAWGATQRFAGVIDEIAVYDRALAPAEIAERYRRGALRLRLQVRGCDDPACDGEAFAGPDGTAATFYDEGCAGVAAPPSLALNDLDCDGDGVADDGPGLVVPPSRYVQVRAVLESDAPGLTPELTAISMCP